MSALEALADGNLPDASREAHRWVHQKRVAGALLDELVARRRYGDVFARAGVPESAVRQFVMADAQDHAVRAASAAPESLDMSQFLDVSANWVQAARRPRLSGTKRTYCLTLKSTVSPRGSLLSLSKGQLPA